MVDCFSHPDLVAKSSISQGRTCGESTRRSAPAAVAEEVRPWLDGVGLLLSHVAYYRELEHLSLIGHQEQEAPQYTLAQPDQLPTHTPHPTAEWNLTEQLKHNAADG